jgi:hypothetical protein
MQKRRFAICMNYFLFVKKENDQKTNITGDKIQTNFASVGNKYCNALKGLSLGKKYGLLWFPFSS